MYFFNNSAKGLNWSDRQKLKKMNIVSYIEINLRIMMGNPVIKDTRLTVEMILKSLAAGETFDNILDHSN